MSGIFIFCSGRFWITEPPMDEIQIVYRVLDEYVQ